MPDIETETPPPPNGADADDRRPFARTKRIHISLPETLRDKIMEAQGKTHNDNITDVIRDAVLLYVALVNERRAGNEVIVRSKHGHEKEYSVFLE